jgi:N-acetylglucosamine kinase-like BadF-type ATPase
MTEFVLAVDGGNSKTDVAIVSATGLVLSWVRGPGSALGPDRAAGVLADLAATAVGAAGLDAAVLRRMHGACYLAGVDLPEQHDEFRDAIAARLPLRSVDVGNDAWSIVRLAPADPVVGIVCGAGLKCVARAGERRLEFPGLGWSTGDLCGGGDYLARSAVRAAARAVDGRGPSTALVDIVGDDLAALAPQVLAVAAAGDEVATTIVTTLAEEVAVLARTAARRLGSEGWTLVLGGGLFADPAGRLLGAVRRVASGLDAEFAVVVAAAPPVLGAALLGLDRIGRLPAEPAVRAAFAERRPSVTRSPCA